MNKVEDTKINPLKIQDNTFRDGHQSIYATRMRTEDMLPIAEEMDSCGFHAMEVWGGATFDTMHRFLAEDPWMRPKILKKYITKTPFAMLIRGQNLVGYRHYADDVVRAFVDKACEIGIDIFRCFDALNDFRNMESCAERIKANGKEFQGAVCYSLTDVRMGGDVYNLEYFVRKAKELEQMGADAICIKDMGGILSPFDAYDLVAAIKKEIKVPLHLHSHYTSGMASMTYLKAIEAGVDVVDTCLAPFALRTSMPAIEPIVAALRGTARETGMDLHKLLELGEHLENIAPKYNSHLATHKLSIIDNGVLAHQIPGGMISNLTGQLKEMNALDRLGEIYTGSGRDAQGYGLSSSGYSSIANHRCAGCAQCSFWPLCKDFQSAQGFGSGLYGKTPMPIDAELTKKILKNYKRGQEPVSGRPADYLEPEIEAAKKSMGELARSDEDVLAYILYPATMTKFLQTKYGIESTKDAGAEKSHKKGAAA